MSEISVVVVGSTSINSVVGNGDTVNVNVGDQTVGGGNGQAATIQAGTVTTIDATQTATVTNVGSAYAAKFNFSLPRGYTGSAGPANSLSISTVSTGTTAAVSISGSAPSQSLSFVLQPGPAGPANSLSIGSVSTGTTAAVSISGSAPSQSLSFVLPQGPAGPANSLSVGSVSTGATAAVSISGSAPSQSLSFVLQPGPTGPANSLSIGSVSTGATAAVSISGSAPSQSLSFVLQPGPTGPANSLSIGSVTTGTTAAVSISGSAPSQSISFVLPAGPKGDTGPQGPAGSVNLADETPQPLGTASAGTALSAARADHVHAQGSIAYSGLTGIPSTFAPSAHTHAVSDVTGLQTALDGKQASGTYATLVGGTVPSSQLPSYVDDVVEYANLAAFTEQSTGKIYVARDTGKVYRWSGSAYVEISPSPGSTDSVTEGSTNLYYTNARAAAAAPVQSVAGRTGTVTLAKADVGLGSVDNTADTAKPISTATQAALDGKAATSHTHSLASLTQSSATTGQVVTWNGSAWAAASPSGGGGGSANIVEAATAAGFPATGASGTIYIATDASRAYRWSGSVYVEIGTSGGGGSGGDGADSTLRSLFVPSAPTSVTASAGNAQATVSWTAPAGTISQAPVTDYVVQYSSNSGSSWTTFSDGTSTATSATVTGLTNGTAYVFRAAAVNALGQGAWSSASSAVTPSAFQPSAVLLTSGSSYTVPSGAGTMKAWVIGAGGSQGAALGNAGAVAYRTWSVTPGASVAYSLGANSSYYSRSNTTLTYNGTTISAQSGSGSDWNGSEVATFSGGDGGAGGGLHGYPSGSGGSGGAIGGNSGPASCGRYTATDVSGLFAAVVLAGGSVTESCGSTAAFGSGGTVNNSLRAGIGGGGAYFGGDQSTTGGGSSAVVLYFTA